MIVFLNEYYDINIKILKSKLYYHKAKDKYEYNYGIIIKNRGDKNSIITNKK